MKQLNKDIVFFIMLTFIVLLGQQLDIHYTKQTLKIYTKAIVTLQQTVLMQYKLIK